MVTFFATNDDQFSYLNRLEILLAANAITSKWSVQDFGEIKSLPALTVHAHGNVVAPFLPRAK